MISRIYKLVFLLLHVIFSIYETFRWFGLRLQAAMLWSYDLPRSLNVIESRDRILLEECKHYLTKLPKHLNIIVGPRDAHVNEALLSRIISYALIMNINCVSFYDTRHSKSGQLQINQLRTPKGFHSKQINDQHYAWICDRTETTHMRMNGKKNGVCNGAAAGATLINGCGSTVEQLQHKNDNSMQIYEITPKQGRPLIAEVCLSLRRKNLDIVTKNRTHLTECIDNELSQLLDEMPEPELSIIFNKYTCTFGILPWQTRFTEFHTHDSERCFNAYTFVNILCKYSGCEQRWGT